MIGVNPKEIFELSQIPFLPVEFFKNHKVVSQDFDYQTFFTSSSTSGTGVSTHFVKNLQEYFDTTDFCFSEFMGDYRNFCHLALLPSYMEREGSSLISMIAHFNQHSFYEMGGFYLNEFEELKSVLLKNEKMKIPTILWGVSFALLDFAEFFSNKLQHTIVIETGGMKGRRREVTRSEMYKVLQNGFGKSNIASEYGMTEMMSQCYSSSDGIYSPPSHVRVFGREINDPLSFVKTGRNKALNIIDLANIHSCAFLALSDIGNINKDGTFEVLGRLDLSDVRGCNLMVK